MNQLIDSMPSYTNPTNRSNTVKIMFSHVPLTTQWTSFTDKVLAYFTLCAYFYTNCKIK